MLKDFRQVERPWNYFKWKGMKGIEGEIIIIVIKRRKRPFGYFEGVDPWHKVYLT